MKTTFVVLTLMFCGAAAAEDVVVDSKYLSADAKEHAHGLTQESKDAAAKASEWVGVGHEIGIATHEALSAVADDINKFSGTPVGHFIMWMVAFKVLGASVLHMGVGIPVYLFGCGVWIWLYRMWFKPRKVLVSEEYDETTKKRTKNYEYHVYDPGTKTIDTGVVLACGWVSIVAWTIIMMLTIFNGWS